MTESSRILALDLGERRIGVAVSDISRAVAQPVTVITRTTPESDLESIAVLLREYEVGEILVGYPRPLRGDVGPQAKQVDRFAARLRQAFGIIVRRWDERLSTVEAQRYLREAAVGRTKRRQLVDKVAATLILQSYLDRRRKGE